MIEQALPVAIVVAGKMIIGWISYDISTSITEAPARFSMSIPFDDEAWALLKPDQPVRLTIGGFPILSGFIDDSPATDGESGVQIDVTGRCRVSRLTDESAPGINFSGLGIAELIGKVASPWFLKVTLSNARNRAVVRGKGKKARAASEPVKINTKAGTAIEPGQTRWSVIERLLQQTGYIAFSAGDGTELVVGKPNYDQEVQFRFFRAAARSPRAAETNVLGMTINRSTAERYSRVICVGSGQGTPANYGNAAASRYGEAKNFAGTIQGEGKDFSAPKTLVIQHSNDSIDQARELARREMAQRDASGHSITVRCAGHGQYISTQFLTVFAPDTLAYVEDERTGTRGVYLITSCTYRSTRDGGEETEMHLVSKGTELGR